MGLCCDTSRISESLEGLKMKRESHRNSRGNGKAVRELCKGGRLKKVLQILDHNDPEGKQAYSGAAYASLLQACNKLKAVTEGKQIHAHISKAGFEPDIFLCSTIISMYTKCLSVAEVMEVLDKICCKETLSHGMLSLHGMHRMNFLWKFRSSLHKCNKKVSSQTRSHASAFSLHAQAVPQLLRKESKFMLT